MFSDDSAFFFWQESGMIAAKRLEPFSSVEEP